MLTPSQHVCFLVGYRITGVLSIGKPALGNEGHDVVEKSTRKIYNMPGLTAKLFCTFTKFFAETAIEQKWIIRLR